MRKQYNVINLWDPFKVYCKISGTHFRVLEEWYGYLVNVVELFK